VVLLVSSIRGQVIVDIIDQELEAQVQKVVNNYMLGLNALVEYGVGPSCDLSTVNVVGLTAAATAHINQFFSDSVQAFVVTQNTASVPNPAAGAVSNISIGTAAIPAIGQPAIHTCADLKNYLKSYFVGFSGFFFSSPFWWLLSAPVVTIVRRDAAYGNRLTAHVDANNENKGFFCAGSQRGFRIQYSRYSHVLIQEAGTWKFIKFGEDNKGMVTLDASGIVQTQPQFPSRK